MKKIISIVIAVIFVLSMIVAGTACKQQTAAETTAAAESTAAETTAVDTTTVVAEGKELMIFQMPYWSAPVARGWEKGGQIMAKYLGIEVIWKGDTWDDMENDTVEAKAAFAMKPAAVLTLAGINPNLDQLYKDYHDSGGIIISCNGFTTKNFPIDSIVGTDNYVFGQTIAERLNEAIKDLGKVKIGMISRTDQPNHIVRQQGVKDWFAANNTDVTVVDQIVEEASGTAECAQNLSAFLAANPDVKALLGTSSMGGAAFATVVKESGLTPGEIIYASADTGKEIFDAIKDGTIYGTLGQGFVSEAIYAITIAHYMYTNLYSESANPETRWAPTRLITPLPWITKDNIDEFSNLE